MSPYATTLAHARLDALRKLIAALNEAETPEEKRRCAVAIFNAPDPSDLDDEIECEEEETDESDDADQSEDDSDFVDDEDDNSAANEDSENESEQDAGFEHASHTQPLPANPTPPSDILPDISYPPP